MNINAFGLEIFNELCYNDDDNKIDENVILSPMSFSLAFSMLLSGSSEEIKAALKNELKFFVDKDALKRLVRVSDVLNSNNGSMKIEFDNYIFAPKYLKQIVSKFGLEVKGACKRKGQKSKFDKTTGKFEKAIKNWVKYCTNEKLKCLSINIDRKTTYVIASTIYFKLNWLNAS